MNWSPNEFFSYIYNKTNQNERIAAVSAFTCGFFCHLFMITNKLPNHDDLRSLVELGGGLRNGRPFSKFAIYLTGTISSPWIKGIMVIIYLSITALTIVKIFKINTKLSSFLIGLTLITFPSVASIMGHMYTSESLTLPICLVTISIYILSKSNKINILKLSLSISMLVFSMCLYQAALGFAISIIVIYLIWKELTAYNNANMQDWHKQFFTDVFKYIVFLIFGIIIYVILIKLLVVLCGIPLSSRKGINSMGIDLLLAVPKRISETYKQFFWYIFVRNSNTTYGLIAKICSILVSICSISIAVFLDIKNNAFISKIRVMTLLLLLLISPIAVEFSYLLVENSSDVNYHMLYSLVLWFIFIVIIFDRLIYMQKELYTKRINIFLWINFLCICIIQIDNWIYTGNAYHVAYLGYEQTYAYFLKMSLKIESTDGFNYNMPIALAGKTDYNNRPQTLAYLDKFSASSYDRRLGHPVTSLPGELTLITTYAHPYFFEYYLGEKFIFCSSNELAKINEMDEVINMPSYPKDGCTKIIDGVLVLKR